MGFSRQEYWSGVPLPTPGDLPNPGTEMNPGLLHCRWILCVCVCVYISMYCTPETNTILYKLTILKIFRKILKSQILPGVCGF